MIDVLKENAVASPIRLTEGAVQQLNEIRAAEKIPADHCLRVGVKGGGCSGFSYILGFDVQKEGDDRFESEGGIAIVMQKSHALYLLGMEIGFVNGLDNRGFTFTNPNAKETCGCGTSFSA